MLAAYEPLFFPPHFDRFVDLFCGGLTTTLWVAQTNPQCVLVVNDANKELMLLYSTLAEHTDAVVVEWKRYVDAWLALNVAERKPYYYSLREQYCLHADEHSDVTLSAQLLFMLQVNFNGMWKAYHKCKGRYSTPPGVCMQGRSFFSAEHVRSVAAVLQRCTIYAGDFADVPLHPGDFVYADPPYRDSEVRYQDGFSERDQVRLVEYLQSHDGPFAYSNKEIGDGFFQQHFHNAFIYPMNARYTAGRGTSLIEANEVLVTNFPSNDAALF